MNLYTDGVIDNPVESHFQNQKEAIEPLQSVPLSNGDESGTEKVAMPDYSGLDKLTDGKSTWEGQNSTKPIDASTIDRFKSSPYYKDAGYDDDMAPVKVNGKDYDGNEEQYQKLQTVSDVAWKGIAGAANLFLDTFTRQAQELPKSVEAIWDFATKADWGKTAIRDLVGTDDEMLQANKEQQDIMNKYAIFHGSYEDNHMFSKEFLFNNIQQFGLGAGQGAEMGMEVFATMGIGAAFDAMRTPMIATKAIEAAEVAAKATEEGAIAAKVFTPEERLLANQGKKDVALQIQKMSDISMDADYMDSVYRRAIKVAKVVGKAIPGSGLITGAADVADALKAGATRWDAWKGGVGTVAKEFSLFNMATTHGKLLAFSTYGSQYADLINQYERSHDGQTPDGEEMDRIRNNAWMAASDNFKLNLPLIMLMGKIEWGGLYSKLGNVKNLLREAETTVAEGGKKNLFNVTGKLTEAADKEIEDGSFGVAQKAGDIGTRSYEKATGLFPAWRTVNMVRKDFGLGTALWEGAKRFATGTAAKFEVMEGLHMVLQNESGEAFQHYYKKMYDGGTDIEGKSFLSSVGDIDWADETSRQYNDPSLNGGLKTFIMGATGGFLMAPIHAVFQEGVNPRVMAKVSGDFRDAQANQKAIIAENIKMQNTWFKDPTNVLNNHIDAIKATGRAASNMSDGAKEGNNYAFHNGKDDVFAKTVSSFIKTGNFDSFLYTLKSMGGMSEKDFYDANPNLKSNIEGVSQKSPRVVVDQMAKDITDYYNNWQKLNDRFSDYIKPEYFAGKGSKESKVAEDKLKKSHALINLEYDDLRTPLPDTASAGDKTLRANRSSEYNQKIDQAQADYQNSIKDNKYVQELQKKRTMQEAIEVMATTDYHAHRAVQRMLDIQGQMMDKSKFPTIGNYSTKVIQVLGDKVNALKESLSLHQNIGLAKDVIGGNDAASKLIDDQDKAYKNQLQHLTNYLDAYDIHSASSDGRVKAESIEKMKAAHDGYIKALNEEVGGDHRITGTTEFNDSFKLLGEHINLAKDYQHYMQAINVLSDPKGFHQMHDHLYSAIKDYMEQAHQEANNSLNPSINSDAKDFSAIKKPKSIDINGKQYTEGELLVGKLNITERLKGTQKVSDFNNDKIRVTRIGGDSIFVSINGEPSVEYSRDEFADAVKDQKITKFSDLSELNKTYLSLRGKVFKYNVMKIGKDGKPAIYSDGKPGYRLVEGRVIKSTDGDRLMFSYKEDGNIKNIEFDQRNVDSSYDLKLLPTEQDLLNRLQAKRDANLKAQIQALEQLVSTAEARISQRQALQNKADEDYAKTEKELRDTSDELSACLSLLSENEEVKKSGRPSSHVIKNRDARAAIKKIADELPVKIESLKSTLATQKALKDELRIQVDELIKSRDTYMAGLLELDATGKSFERGDHGGIADETEKNLNDTRDALISKKPSDRLENALSQTSAELDSVSKKIGFIEKAITEFSDILNSFIGLDKVFDSLAELSKHNYSNSKLQGQLIQLRNKSEDPYEIATYQALIKSLGRDDFGIEAQYVVELSGRLKYAKDKLKQLKEAQDELLKKESRLSNELNNRSAIESLEDRVQLLKDIQSAITKQVSLNKIAVKVGTAKSQSDDEENKDNSEVELNYDEETFTYSDKKPVMTPTSMMKTAGTHFYPEGVFVDIGGEKVFFAKSKNGYELKYPHKYTPEQQKLFINISAGIKERINNGDPLVKSIENDTHLISDQGQARFFKFSDTINDLQHIYFEVDNTNKYGLKETNDPNEIKLIAKKKVGDKYVYIGVDGNELTSEQIKSPKDHFIYQSVAGSADALSFFDKIGESKEVNGSYGYVDKEGNLIPDSKLASIYPDAILWAKNKFVVSGLSDTQILDIVRQYRDARKSLMSSENLHVKAIGQSNGIQAMIPKIDGRPAEMPLSGRLINKETKDWDNMVHPDGSPVSLVIATTANTKELGVKPGRLVAQKGNTKYRIFNREMSEPEKRNIANLLKLYTHVFGLSQELRTEDSEATRDAIRKFLQSNLFWKEGKQSKNQFHIDWVDVKIGDKIERIPQLFKGDMAIPFTEAGIDQYFHEMTDKMYFSVNGKYIKPGIYNEQSVVDGKLKTIEHPNYTEYLLNGTKPIVYCNVPEYVKPSTGDGLNGLQPQRKSVYMTYEYTPELKSIPVIKEIKPAIQSSTTEIDSIKDRIKYLNDFINRSDSANREEKLEVWKLEAQLAAIESKSIANPPTTVHGYSIDNLPAKDLTFSTKTKAGQSIDIVTKFNNGVREVTDIKGIKLDDETKTLAMFAYQNRLNKGIADEKSNIADNKFFDIRDTNQKVDLDNPTFTTTSEPHIQSDPTTSEISTSRIDRLRGLSASLVSGSANENYRLAVNKNKEGTENMNQVRSWFAKNLPQIGLKSVDQLIDGKAWGKFANGIAYIYNNAGRGTGFHEAFEAVWNTYLSDSEQSDLVSEFKAQEGTFRNPYTGKTKSFADADTSDVKEMLADGFSDYKDSVENDEPTTALGKIGKFFKSLWEAIKKFFNKTPEEIIDVSSKINEVYKKMDTGRYAVTPEVRDFNLTDNYKKIPGVSTEIKGYAIEGLTNIFFRKLFQSGNNVDGIISSVNSKVINEIMGATFKEYEDVINNHYLSIRDIELGKTYTDQQAIDFDNDYSKAFPEYTQAGALIDQKQLLSNEFYSFLKKFGLDLHEKSLQSVENDTEVGIDATLSKEGNVNPLGILDAVSIDPRKLTTANLDMLLASLTDDVYNSAGSTTPKVNPIGLAKLVGFNKVKSTLLNELSNSISVIRNGIRVSAMDVMFERLDKKYKEDGRYRDGYLWINKLKTRLKVLDLNGSPFTGIRSADDVRMVIGFEKSFTNLMSSAVKTRFGADGYIYDLDPMSETNKERIKLTWENKGKSMVMPGERKPSSILYASHSNGEIMINPDYQYTQNGRTCTLNDFQTIGNPVDNKSDFNNMIDKLNSLGFSFSIDRQRLFWKKDLIKKIVTEFTPIASLISSVDPATKITSINQLWNGKVVGARMNALVAVEQSLSSEDNIMSFMNSEGKSQYGISTPSAFSHILNSLKSVDNLTDFIDSNPHLGKVVNGVVLLDPYVAGSELLKLGGMLFDAAGKKRGDITYKLITGVDVIDEDNGKNTDELSWTDRMIQQAYHILNKTFYAGINSDKSSEFGLQIPSYFLTLSQVRQSVGNKIVLDIYTSQLKDEMRAAVNELLNPKNIEVYSRQVFKLGHFNSILGQKLVSKFFTDVIGGTIGADGKYLLPKIKNKDSDRINDAFEEKIKKFIGNSEIQPKIESYITNQVNALQSRFIEEGILKQTQANAAGLFDYATNHFSAEQFKLSDVFGETKDMSKLSQLDITSLLRFFVVNQEIATTEQNKLVYGHPAFYKDFAKRSSAATATKEVLVDNPQVITHMNEAMKRMDGKVRDTQKPSIINVTYKKAIVQSSSLPELIKQFELRALPTKELIKAYKEMDEADAQGNCLPDFYRDLNFMSGKWTNEMDAQHNYFTAYEINSRSNKYKDHPSYREYTQEQKDWAKTILAKGDQGVVLKVIKPQYFGYSSLGAPVFLKNSVAPLYYLFVEGTNRESMYVNMQVNQVDLINYSSGQKVGEPNNSPDFYGKDGRWSGIIPRVQTLPTRYFGIQTEVPEEKDKVVRGTQVSKLIFSNFKINGRWIDEKADGSSTAKQLYEDYNNTLISLISHGKEDLLKEFGVSIHLDNESNSYYKVDDVDKLVSLLQKEAESRNLPDNVKDAIQSRDGELVYKFDSLSNRGKIEEILASIIDSRVISGKMPGKPLVQVASTGYETGARAFKDGVLTSNNLKFYELKNGKIQSMECYIKWPFKGIKPEDLGLTIGAGGIYRMNEHDNQSKIDGRLMDLVGFRIPTQGMNSIESIKVAGFTHLSMGDVIIVPTEIVAKSGSDFDIDKLNTYIPNYSYKDGKLSYVEHDELKMTPRERYEAYINDKSDGAFKKEVSQNVKNELKAAFATRLTQIKNSFKNNTKESNDANYKKYQDNITESTVAMSSDPYISDLFNAGKQVFKGLDYQSKEGFFQIKDRIESENISGPQEIQMYLDHANLLKASNSFPKDSEAINNIIPIYEEELRVLGIQNSWLDERKSELLKAFQDAKQSNRDINLAIKQKGIDAIKSEKASSYQDLMSGLTDQMAEYQGLPSFEEFSKLSHRDQLTKKALQNQLISKMQDMIGLEENYQQLLTPNSAATLKSLAEEINNIKGISSEDANLAKLRQIEYIADTRHKYLTSKKMVGIGALQTTLHAVAQISGLKLNGTFDLKDVYWLRAADSGRFFDYMKSKYGADLSKEDLRQKMLNEPIVIRLNHDPELRLDNGNDNSGQLISELHSESLTGIVDAAKDPFVFDLNINMETSGTWFYLNKIKVPVKDIAYLQAQPIVVDYFKALTRSKSLINKANDDQEYSLALLAKAASPYYKKINGQTLAQVSDQMSDPAFYKAGASILESFMSDINDYRKANPSITADQLKEGLLAKDGMFQIGCLFDYLEYRTQASMLSQDIMGIGYDNSRTHSIVEIRTQQAKWEKALEKNFISNLQSVMSETFIGEMQKQKQDVPAIMKDFFTTLDDRPSIRKVFQPMFERLSNINIRDTADAQTNILTKYQNFLLTYLLHTQQVGGKSLNARYGEVLFGDKTVAKSLSDFQKSADSQVRSNPVLKELIAIFPDNTNKEKTIRLFKRVLDTYDTNMLTEAISNLYDYAQATQDKQLSKFVEDLGVLTILQSGMQPTTRNFQKILPTEIYTKLVQGILSEFTNGKGYEINPALVYKQFHQNNVRDSNLIPKIGGLKVNKGRSFMNDDGSSIFIDPSNDKSNYDYLKRNVLVVSKEKLAELQAQHRGNEAFDTYLYEKVMETPTGHLQYNVINKLGDSSSFTECYTNDNVKSLNVDNDRINESKVKQFTNNSSNEEDNYYKMQADKESQLRKSMAGRSEAEINNALACL